MSFWDRRREILHSNGSVNKVKQVRSVRPMAKSAIAVECVNYLSYS